MSADPESDLDPALQARIADLSEKLETIDYYALLEVSRTAEKKAIKSAYFAKAAQLHPDRYFGKRLGPWKQKMELIFGRLTLAHETLTHPTARPEYDAYLAERDHMLALERALEVDESIQPAEERPVDPSAIRASPSTPRMPAQPAAPTPEDERARREALARRLAGGTHRRMAAVRPPSGAMPAVTPPAPRPQAGVEVLVNAARNALSLGDLVSASNKMRLAAKIDARYAAEAEALTKRVHASMAEGYEKQARYEESQLRWIEAAISWGKAFEGRPEQGTYAERAANALRRGGGDLHKAAQLGEQAVRLRPDDARAHATLAWVYLDAGLARRAKAEIDIALRLAPTDPEARELARLIGTRA
ncbi:MAG: DnaJ domain-containing protein [Polyangiales bacterium]